jgi:hypothetical protein
MTLGAKMFNWSGFKKILFESPNIRNVSSGHDPTIPTSLTFNSSVSSRNQGVFEEIAGPPSGFYSGSLQHVYIQNANPAQLANWISYGDNFWGIGKTNLISTY